MFERLARHLPRPERARRDAVQAGEAEGLARGVAEGIYRQEMRRGGWVAELGVFGPDLFLDEAEACLDAIALGNEPGSSPAP